MHYYTITGHRPTHTQWRGLTLIAVSAALFALTVAFGQPWGLPVALRALFAACAGVGVAAGQLMRGRRS